MGNQLTKQEYKMYTHNCFTPIEQIKEGDFIEIFIESHNSPEICQVVSKFKSEIQKKQSRGIPSKDIGLCDCLSLDCRGIEELVFWYLEEQRWYNEY